MGAEHRWLPTGSLMAYRLVKDKHASPVPILVLLFLAESTVYAMTKQV